MLRYLANRNTIWTARALLALFLIAVAAISLQKWLLLTAIGPAMLIAAIYRSREQERIRKTIVRQIRRLERLAIEERFSGRERLDRDRRAIEAVNDSITVLTRLGIIVTGETRRALRRAIGLTGR